MINLSILLFSINILVEVDIINLYLLTQVENVFIYIFWNGD